MATSTTPAVKVLEPATEQILAEVPQAQIEDVEEAIARAKGAFPTWRAMAPSDRAGLLRRFAEAIEDRAEDLAKLEARNVGKPIADARGEMGMVVHAFRYFAGAPERLFGRTIPVAGGVDMIFREPLGVVGLITPWNFPLMLATWKVAPALAAGNTVVLKPAELTPLTALEVERIGLDAGLPVGVFNVVVGPGRTIGERLVEHPDVAKIAFTGSTEVGKRVGQLAAQSIKRVKLELCGKSANVIFDDEADAIRLANDTIYGLSGSIWTRDGGRALRVARAIDTGTLSINSNTSVRVNTPFGGFKHSGLGRELGRHALEYYTELKNVYMSKG